MYILTRQVQVTSLKKNPNIRSTVPVSTKSNFFSKVKKSRDDASEYEHYMSQLAGVSSYAPEFEKECVKYMVNRPLTITSGVVTHLDISLEFETEEQYEKLMNKPGSRVAESELYKHGVVPVNMQDYFYWRVCLASDYVIKGQAPATYGHAVASLRDPVKEKQVEKELAETRQKSMKKYYDITQSTTGIVDSYALAYHFRNDQRVSYLRGKSSRIASLFGTDALYMRPLHEVRDTLLALSDLAPKEFVEVCESNFGVVRNAALVNILVEAGILELSGGAVYTYEHKVLAETKNDMILYLVSKDPVKSKIVATMCLKLMDKLPDETLKDFAKTTAADAHKIVEPAQ